MKAINLPINSVIDDIKAHLASHPALVLQAPPGAGKTTLVPLALLDEPWLKGQTILMLEPRRLATRAAAARMAELLNEPVGRSVGYRVRFDAKVSRDTRIEVLTEGILTRRLQHDPELAGVGLVIFDEQHERNLHTDLALALAKESRDALREDLRLLVMSATLDGAGVSRLLDGAPVVASEGRGFPVAVHYLPRDPGGPVSASVARTVKQALRENQGDVLAFLPGGAEIRQTKGLLEADSTCADVHILPLYGDLPYAEQQRALRPDPQGRRKIVLATPIAETSLTIDGVSVVVDSGYARVPRFEPRSGLTRMTTARIAADSAEQRAGRAGRLGPGLCYRLWSEATQRGLRPRRVPEILDADLAPLALELALWGVKDATALAWLDPPPQGALAQARDLLVDLEALGEDGTITTAGRGLAALPMHPRLAQMLLRGAELGLAGLACELAALLDERDILRGQAATGCDLSVRVEALHAFRDRGKEGAQRFGVDPAACARVDKAATAFRRLLKGKSPPAPLLQRGETGAVGLLLAFAYPDRIAQRREGKTDRYRLANGRGARLREFDPMVGQDWLVAAHLDAGEAEGRIFLGAAVAPEDLETYLSSRIHDAENVSWNIRQQAVTAVRERRIGELALSTLPLADADPARLRQAMLEGVRRLGLDALPWTRDVRGWQARVLSLCAWFPEEGWPDLSDAWLAAHLGEWLEPYLDGIARREHLARLDLGAILKNRLDWSWQSRLDRAAPTHIVAPSGSRLRLRYEPGAPPVLAVRLQEMFGLADTPRVADGRIPVVLHLLSPARRPIQVTQDLRGFWENTYAEVKKELKGRYPKHYWPDNPWTATPTRRVRPDSG